MKARFCRAVISTFLLGVMMLTSGIVATRSMAGKAKITPGQFTIYFTGDDWAGYKGSCG